MNFEEITKRAIECAERLTEVAENIRENIQQNRILSKNKERHYIESQEILQEDYVYRTLVTIHGELRSYSPEELYETQKTTSISPYGHIISLRRKMEDRKMTEEEYKKISKSPNEFLCKLLDRKNLIHRISVY